MSVSGGGLLSGIRVWFSPNLLIQDLELRQQVQQHGATLVDEPGAAAVGASANHTPGGGFVLHVVASTSDSVCAQLQARAPLVKLATVHYMRELLTGRHGVLPTEWNGNVLASFALKNVVVCCTGLLPEEKTRLHRVVFALGGAVARTLQAGVTHLVANKTDTIKYMELSHQILLAAQRLQRSAYDSVVVCQPAWLDRCDREQPLHRDAVPSSANFRLLPLAGLTCALSGFRNSMRQVVQDAIEMLGGKFTPALSLATTHLVCASENTDKYRHCVKDSLEGRKIVSLEWLVKCAELGMRVQEAQYAFTKSTPSDADDHLRLCSRLEVLLMCDTDGVIVRRHGLFAGKYFATHGVSAAERERLKRFLCRQGGALFKASETRAFERADYIVAEHGVVPPPSAQGSATLVSSMWLMMCLQMSTLLNVKDCVAFRPLTCRVPLGGADAATVHVTGQRATQARALAELLGFGVTEALSRAVTHLIVQRAEYNRHKIAAAHNMGVLCVWGEWLAACAAAGQIVDVSGFDVDATTIAKAELDAAAAATALQQRQMQQSASVAATARSSEALHKDAAASSDDDDDGGDIMARVLKGVSLYVARDEADRELLHALADELGARTSVQPDAAVTHFVYTGVAQKSSEYHALMRKRPSDAKLLCVSPLWLNTCRDAKLRVDEALFPSMYDPLRAPLMPTTAFGNTLDAAATTAAVAAAAAAAASHSLPDIIGEPSTIVVPSTRKRATGKGNASTAVLRTKRLGIPREQPRTVGRVTSGAHTGALMPWMPSVGRPAPTSMPPPTARAVKREPIELSPELSHGGDTFVDQADEPAPMPRPPAPAQPAAPDAAELDEQLAQRIEGLINNNLDTSLNDSLVDAMPLDLNDHDVGSELPMMPAARRPPRLSISAHDAHDADTTSVMGAQQQQQQLVRYGLSADEKKRRDEALARSKRRKLAVDDSKGVAVAAAAAAGAAATALAKANNSSSAGNNEPLGVHVSVSNFTVAQADDLTKRLRNLSAVIDKEVLPRVTTHIVINFPSRSVKFLCGLASGAWLLTPAWVEASERAGFIVDPTAYEWSARTAAAHGDPKVVEAAKQDSRIFRAPTLNRRACVTTAATVFADWTIALIMDDKRRKMLEPILRCGGATIHAALVSGLTHIMIENNCVDTIEPAQLKQIRSLMRSGVQVVNTSFLHEYLITFPRPNPNDAEFQVHMLQTTTRSSSVSKSRQH